MMSWELGSGMGHTGRLRPIVEHLQSRGASVHCLAIRDQDAAKHLPCPVEEAPWLKPPKREGTFWGGHLADTLAALGWSDPAHLHKAVGRWRVVLEKKQPNLLVMDSSPTAMLASLGLPMKRIWLANHWSTPPREHPLPDLQARFTDQTRPTPDTEPVVVNAINTCLEAQGQPTIQYLYELFDRADKSPMLSIPEIDPHGPRPNTKYLGVWGSQPGSAPPWSACSHGPNTPGIFAYLKPFPQRAATLKLLSETGLPVQVFAPLPDDSEKAAAHSESTQLYTSPIDWLAKQATTAFVLCHGGAGMTGRALQLGLPVLALPTSLEQTAVTMQASQTGACIGADIQNISSIGSALEQMFSDEKVFEAAEALGKKYEHYDPEKAAIKFADSLLA